MGGIIPQGGVRSVADGGALSAADTSSAQNNLPNQLGITAADETQLGQLMQSGLTWAQATAVAFPASTPSFLTPSAATLAAWQPVITARAAAGYYCR